MKVLASAFLLIGKRGIRGMFNDLWYGPSG